MKKVLFIIFALMLLTGCNAMKHEQTRLYPIEEFTIHENGNATVKAIVEDNSIHYIDFEREDIYFYDGESKIILESYELNGSINDGIIGRYLYLNVNEYADMITEGKGK